MGIEPAQKLKMKNYYRNHLLEDIIPFWEKNSADTEAGGYITALDQTGNPISRNKWIWAQGRQTYAFAALYNQLEKRPQWLDFAKSGRDFLVEHAYAGDGRWFYKLDRFGRKIIQDNLSIATDAFALMGLCEYAMASGSDRDIDIIEETFKAIENSFKKPGKKQFHHIDLAEEYEHHSPYMVAINLGAVVSGVTGAERTKELVDLCLEKVLYFFSRDKEQALFEMLNPDGTVAEAAEGAVINPGHALESMWFCIEEALKRKDNRVLERASRITSWHITKAWDEKYGGIVAFMNPGGQSDRLPPRFPGKTGVKWNSKIWWVHSEALYALALCAEHGDASFFYPWFVKVHDYVKENFVDKEHGEWFMQLEPDGSPQTTDKSTGIRCAFHSGRALSRLVNLLGKTD